MRNRIFQIDKLYLKGKVQGLIIANTENSGCMQNPDNQARVHDFPEHLPVRVRTQTRHAQAGL